MALRRFFHKIVGQIDCTLRHEFKHLTHLTAGECWTQCGAHITPFIAGQHKQIVAEEHIDLFIDKRFVVRKVIEMFHRQLFQ